MKTILRITTYSTLGFLLGFLLDLKLRNAQPEKEPIVILYRDGILKIENLPGIHDGYRHVYTVVADTGERIIKTQGLGGPRSSIGSMKLHLHGK